jgi:hypothetical protein
MPRPKTRATRGPNKAATSRAWLAMTRLRSRVPVLTKYARMVTRNPKITVEVTTGNTATDGKVIYIKPPIQLGDNLRHKVGSCGQRGYDRRLMCPACDVDELVMGLLYHELAHIVFGSHVKPNIPASKAIGSLIREWHDSKVCEHAEWLAMELFNAETYLHALNPFDGRLGLLVNALEDARVNARMFEGRPGTRAMMDATMHDIFTNGIPDHDGEPRQWSDVPLDMQVVMGLCLVASGYYDHLLVLHEDAREILGDEVIDQLITGVADVADAHELVIVSIKIWRRLQELGIILLDKCVEQPEAPEQPDEDEGPGESGEGKGDSSNGDAEDGDESGGFPSGGNVSGTSSGNAGEDQSSGQPDVEDDDGPGEGGDDPQSEQGTEGDDDGGTEADSGGDTDDDGPSDEGESDESDRTAGDGGVDAQASEGSDAAGDEASEAEAPEGGSGDGTDGEPADGADEAGDGDDSDEGEDEDDESGEDGGDEPADRTPSSLEELRDALNRISVHKDMPGSTEEFAIGTNQIHEPDQGHDHSVGNPDGVSDREWQAALEKALLQAAWFDGPSENVDGVTVINFPSGYPGIYEWHPRHGVTYANYMPDQSVLGPVVVEGRIAFSPNKKSAVERGLKSGRINGKSMARQIPFGGERIFQRKTITKARNYHVIITLDISGSTRDPLSYSRSGRPGGLQVIDLIVSSVAAQAEALHRLGISFEIWAHSAGMYLDADEFRAYDNGTREGWKVWMFQIKSIHDKWDDRTREKLISVRPTQGNLDGHTLQFLRKRADEVKTRFSDVVLCYYTDGAMPAANSHEEGELLREETDVCRRRGYPLIAVGARTDSPKEWGFDTVQIDTTSDLPKVMTQLRKQLGI